MSKFVKISLEVIAADEKFAKYLRQADIKPAKKGGAFVGNYEVAPDEFRKYGIVLPKGGMIIPDMEPEELKKIVGVHNEAKNFFWGGKYAPGALLVGRESAPQVPPEGLPCRFFLSRSGGWCIDFSKEKGQPHRLFQEDWTNCQTGLPRWYANVNLPGVVAQKWALSNGGGTGYLYTVVREGMTPEIAKKECLRQMTGRTGEYQETSVYPVLYRWHRRSSNTYDRSAWVLATQKYGDSILLVHEEDSPIGDVPRFFIRVLWGMSKSPEYISCSPEAAREYMDREKGVRQHIYKVWKDQDGLFRSEKV